ncbi:MAG: hypothetical protein CSA51_01120 [Gammaproteobacteria bacterium]|nr:MAG: hypothetical protein CSA51_01120 [Gammaproteobacteria bacterium]
MNPNRQPQFEPVLRGSLQLVSFSFIYVEVPVVEIAIVKVAIVEVPVLAVYYYLSVSSGQ